MENTKALLADLIVRDGILDYIAKFLCAFLIRQNLDYCIVYLMRFFVCLALSCVLICSTMLTGCTVCENGGKLFFSFDLIVSYDCNHELCQRGKQNCSKR